MNLSQEGMELSNRIRGIRRCDQDEGSGPPRMGLKSPCQTQSHFLLSARLAEEPQILSSTMSASTPPCSLSVEMTTD